MMHDLFYLLLLLLSKTNASYLIMQVLVEPTKFLYDVKEKLISFLCKF